MEDVSPELSSPPWWPSHKDNICPVRWVGRSHNSIEPRKRRRLGILSHIVPPAVLPIPGNSTLAIPSNNRVRWWGHCRPWTARPHQVGPSQSPRGLSHSLDDIPNLGGRAAPNLDLLEDDSVRQIKLLPGSTIFLPNPLIIKENKETEPQLI